MSVRKLPESAAGRLTALQAGKERKDAIPAPPVIPYTANTITRLDTFYPIHKAKVEAMEAALVAQTNITATVKAARGDAEMYISHFFQALQNAIRRGVYDASVRGYYGLDINDGTVPPLKSEAEITYWGGKAATGEAARIAAGGTAVPFPTIGEVNTKVNAFKAANQLQANAKDLYDIAQEAVEAENIEADKLILKMWNETETAFDEGDKPSMRRKSRDWGVVYAVTPGEQLDPNEFSMFGRVTDLVTGTKIEDVIVRLEENNTIAITDTHGYYYMPVQTPGTYTVQVIKNGYEVKEIPGTVITAGNITTLNIQLTPGTTTGVVSGMVAQGGNPVQATLTIVAGSSTLTTHTLPDGSFTFTGVPIGSQVVSASLDSNPAMIQSQTVDVEAGETVTVNFSFA